MLEIKPQDSPGTFHPPEVLGEKKSRGSGREDLKGASSEVGGGKEGMSGCGYGVSETEECGQETESSANR